jgi:putative colanic acid biosynthesis glycosyltransferase WcaI
VPYYVDALAAIGWRVEVCAPYPFNPAWKIDRSVPPVSYEHGGLVRVTRYAPFVPRHHSALTRGLHEATIALHALRMLRRHARNADLVVVTSPPLLAAACAVRIAHRNGKPCLLLAYDLVADLASDAYGPAGRAAGLVLHRVEANLCAHADRVIALTEDMASRIRRIAKRSSPVPVIRIWADDELARLDHAAAAGAARERLGIPAERRLVGFAGSFGRKQHLEDIVGALRTLPPAYTTVFIGDGPDRPELERLAADGPGDVLVLPPQPLAELHAFLSACDLSIVIAWTEHAGSLFPSKVANILAAGSPILAITHRGTELAELLERERIGLICPSLDPEEIRQAVYRGVELGRDPACRERCRQYARAHLDRAPAMRRFLAEVRELVPIDAKTLRR